MDTNNLSEFNESLLGRYSRSLVQYMPRKVGIALGLMVLMSLMEGVSLLLLIPLLQLVGLNVGQGSLGQIAGFVSGLFSSLGLHPTLLMVLVIYVVVISFSALLTRIQTLRTVDIEFRFAAHLRKRLYRAITNSNWMFFTGMKSTNFAHALTNEIERISNGTGQFLTLIAGVMILVVYIIFALKLAGLFTGLIFIVGVVILLLLRRRAGLSRSSGEDITTSTRDLYYSIMQHLDGMKTIKSFGMQDENIRLFSLQTNQVAQRYLGAVESYADVKLLFDVGTVFVLAVLVLVLIEVIKLPTASLLLLIYLFVRMMPQFSLVQHSYQYFINTLPAFDNVMNLEKQCLDNRDITESEVEVVFRREISLENVSFSYIGEEQFTMRDINFLVPAGNTVAIAGPSGAGKSTVADLVMGLIQPEKGSILVDGIPVSGSWRGQIGYVAQETFLFNESVRYNLILARPGAEEKDLLEALELAAARGFVEKLPDGLDTVIGDRGVRLSGGERQRLALARALLRKPALLILDEATSNLDSENEKRILDSVESLHGDMTILVIAHRLSTIRNADRIYLMEEGCIVESGNWDELLTRDDGSFKRVWKAQATEKIDS